MKFIRNIFSKPKQEVSFPDPAPEQEFYAIGDVHGRDDLLKLALRKVPRGSTIICVGDIIDRGENSAQALRRLHATSQRPTRTLICLMGNHERMMLNFLDGADAEAERWLRNGGLQTLESFGVTSVVDLSSKESLDEARATLKQAMGRELEAWLRGLPFQWQSGNVAVVHAGADPELPMDEQPEKALVWGHADFFKVPRKDGVWVVHGHTVVDEPYIKRGRAAIDTGAYVTERLTVAHVTPEGITFI
ncbi:MULTISPECIES: metallophosphoesterase [Halocynthiibacter]|uniref:Metallophosphoesterase n=1 Tax=Halocynthiibacter halioticoli TaxID=2986804 RepID=A0AAE3LQ06_9RHOB|nr:MULTISPECIES: metallophosphoesterase [Halocynthiibacter]MCV6823004.1 metallophosphoesterase [Halocynthiibacter halioticoli]MCW4056005.1 metallophosphoesterase [Halocynthiibacter sp. SDUM655004]